MEDVSKYVKKKKSNVSKASKRADHKHEYELVIVKWVWSDPFLKGKPSYHLGERCTICNKIRSLAWNDNRNFYINEEFNGVRTLRLPTFDEIKARYGQLEVVDELLD